MKRNRSIGTKRIRDDSSTNDESSSESENSTVDDPTEKLKTFNKIVNNVS